MWSIHFRWYMFSFETAPINSDFLHTTITNIIALNTPVIQPIDFTLRFFPCCFVLLFALVNVTIRYDWYTIYFAELELDLDLFWIRHKHTNTHVPTVIIDFICALILCFVFLSFRLEFVMWFFYCLLLS